MPVGINEYQGIENIYTDLIYYGFKSLETDGYPTCIWTDRVGLAQSVACPPLAR